jgi:DNA-binding IclR family transcriptional regulator
MIGSVLKAIEIMQAFNPDHPQLSLNELSQALAYPKTTIHTILKTLESKDFIERGENGSYSLGTAIIPMTQAVRVNVQLRDRAAPLLRELGEYCGESIYLTVKKGPYCLYIYAIESPDRLMARTAVGDTMPMHCTSVGKAILSFLPGEQVMEILSETGLKEYNPRTITTIEPLLEELVLTRKRGFSLDNSEHEENVFCIGAPIFNEKGEPFASCSISGTDKEIIGKRLEDFSAGIRYTAQEISRRMGFVPKADTLIWKDTSNPLRDGKR